MHRFHRVYAHCVSENQGAVCFILCNSSDVAVQISAVAFWDDVWSLSLTAIQTSKRYTPKYNGNQFFFLAPLWPSFFSIKNQFGEWNEQASNFYGLAACWWINRDQGPINEGIDFRKTEKGSRFDYGLKSMLVFKKILWDCVSNGIQQSDLHVWRSIYHEQTNAPLYSNEQQVYEVD